MKNKFSFVIILFLIVSLVFPHLVSAAPDYRNKQEYLFDIKMQDLAYSTIKKGDGITIAVIDQGVWIQHPDLVGKNWINSREIQNNGLDDDNNGYIDDFFGWNFIDNNADMSVKGSHGTAVAGVIAAADDQSGIVGIAPGAKIMPLIVCDNSSCDDTAIINAIRYAADNGADIINLSLGSDNGYVGYSINFNNAIEYAYSRGKMIVASAGNGDPESGGSLGLNLDMFKVSPVSNDVNGINMVVGVGALSLDEVHRTNWSNYGKGVDIYAPGENIFGLTVPAFSNGYGYKQGWNGTSFSAPIVAAVAAILKSNYPNLSNSQLYRSFEITKRILDVGDLYYNAVGLAQQEKPTSYNLCSQIANSHNNSSACVCNSGYEFNSQGQCVSTGQNQTVSSSSTVPVHSVGNATSRDLILQQERGMTKANFAFTSKLKGKILLQVDQKGEAWYVNPNDSKRYYLGGPSEAFNVMRKLGLGVKGSVIKTDKVYPMNLVGRILINVDDSGKAYYVNPSDRKAYYLGKPADAYVVMRIFGLGISNTDLRKIAVE